MRGTQVHGGVPAEAAAGDAIIRPAGRRCTPTGLLYLGRHPGNVETRRELELIEQGLTPGLVLTPW